ncbi:MAG: tRNA (adenosine(37)-N6)-dimethylallyltransferase MiaA [Myxococcaceae bacterium]
MRPHLTVIAGPTASGKTALAIRVARALGAEIVSADSQQVYRGFDIGTAKPSAEELALVPHHLISVVEPTETFSAARYQELADAAIASIAGRGHQVVVVGGTGLYLRVLLHGVVDAPQGDPLLRARLEAEAATLGRAALHARLAAIDPVSAKTIEPTDLVRTVRALEIHALSGVAASEHRARHQFTEDRYPYELWVLSPPREILYAAIDRRARAMFEAGLVEEVRALCARGLEKAPPMGSVGYAQALAVVQGRFTVEQAIAEAAQKTRRYAKRQQTWFKKERGARFVSPPYEELEATSRADRP